MLWISTKMRLQVISSPVLQSLFLRSRFSFFKLQPVETVLNQTCRNLATRINPKRLERIISQNGRRLLEAKSALQELQTKIEKMEDSMLRQPLIYDNAAEASEKDRSIVDLVGPTVDLVGPTVELVGPAVDLVSPIDDLMGPTDDLESQKSCKIIFNLIVPDDLPLDPAVLMLDPSEFNEEFKDLILTKDMLIKVPKHPGDNADGNDFVCHIRLNFSQIKCSADVDAAIEKANIKKECSFGKYFRLFGLKLLRLQAK